MKRWLAVTVTGAVLALGAPAGAQDYRGFTGGELLRYDVYAQNNYVFGVLDGFRRMDGIRCPAGIRVGAALEQAKILMRERPDDLAIERLIEAMGQLGCRWTKTEPRPASPSGPSS